MNFYAYHPADEEAPVLVRINKLKKLGSGATATVYRTEYQGASVAAKIYDKEVKANSPKLKAMLQNPPTNVFSRVNGRQFPQLAWPMAILKGQYGEDVGCLMPFVDVEQSFSLDHYYDNGLFTKLKNKNEGALSYKLEIARNLSALVADLHKHGHHFIDIKPQNIRVFRDTHLVSFIDCDGFSISGQNKRHPAQLVSTDYIAPEAQLAKVSPKDMGVEQDRYALAVILFQLLNEGTHPFQGILKRRRRNINTNDEKAAAGLYPHGLEKHASIDPRPQSTHHLWDDKTRGLFDRAFIKSSSNRRPTPAQWTNHFKNLLEKKILSRCTKVPGDVRHMRFEGKDCPACYRAALPAPKVKRNTQKIRHVYTRGRVQPKVQTAQTSNSPNKGSDANNNSIWIFIGLTLVAVIIYFIYFAG